MKISDLWRLLHEQLFPHPKVTGAAYDMGRAAREGGARPNALLLRVVPVNKPAANDPSNPDGPHRKEKWDPLL